MRFKCNKKEPCLNCAECCRFREKIDFSVKEEENLKRVIFDRTGVIYLYPMTRYTINLSIDEKNVLESEAKKRNITIKILPKKIFLTEKGIVVYDYFIDADVCPFLSKENKCTIYEHRPQICKNFPNIEYDNSEFALFDKREKIVKTNFEKCYEYARKILKEKGMI